MRKQRNCLSSTGWLEKKLPEIMVPIPGALNMKLSRKLSNIQFQEKNHNPRRFLRCPGYLSIHPGGDTHSDSATGRCVEKRWADPASTSWRYQTNILRSSNMVGKSSKWRCLICSWGDHADMSFPASHGWLPDGSPIRLLSFAMGQKLSVLHVIHIKLARIYGCKSMRAASWKKGRHSPARNSCVVCPTKMLYPNPMVLHQFTKLSLLSCVYVYPLSETLMSVDSTFLFFHLDGTVKTSEAPVLPHQSSPFCTKKHVLW